MLSELLKAYQEYDPETRRFDRHRTLREYASLLGVSHTQLIHIYSGERRGGGKIIRGFLQAFPEASDKLTKALSADVDGAQEPAVATERAAS